MHRYAAFIGHQPHLSLAELAATVPSFSLEKIIDRSTVLFASSAELSDAFLDSLGGTVVLARHIRDGVDREDIPDLLKDEVRDVTGKVTFSIRGAGISRDVIRGLLRDCKKRLKKAGKPSRYLGNEREAAPAIALRSQGLVSGKEGRELCVVQQDEKTIWVGVTVGAQDVESYTKRDIRKPVRDTSTGLLPPKLAQILLNLGLWMVQSPKAPETAAEKKGKASKASHIPTVTVFDPFCGTGVIPMECLLRGFPVAASDKSEKAVSGCSKNVEWTRKQYDIAKSNVPSTVWKQDAMKPFDASSFKQTGLPGLIVTETTLGPNLRARPTIKDAQKYRSEVEKLLMHFIQNAAKALPGAPIACTFPVWFTSKGPVLFEHIWKTIDDAGYHAVLPPTVEMLQGRMSLLYRRPEQFVGREIVLLRPKRRK